MIADGFNYIALLTITASLITYLQYSLKWKLFEYLPAIVIIYFGIMVLSSLGIWQKNDAIAATYSTVKSNILPAMIFLLLLQADLRQIKQLGAKILLTFLLASVTIGFGFIGMYTLMHNQFDADAWKAFAALSGSWMGGTGNMVAIQGALAIPDSKMGYVLLMDSINYSIYVMVLLALVPFAKRFNQWSKADNLLLVSVSQKLSLQQNQNTSSFDSLFLLLGLALGVSALSQFLASILPINEFVTTSTWIVILATLFGILLAMTPVGQIAGSSELGNIFLYLMVALIASRADFTQLAQSPLYIFAGFLILTIHMLLMVLSAKIFRLDLFSLGVASLANIGGVASAPILAGAYSKSLIPIGVLMAMLGYIIGTFGGLGVGKVLQAIGG